MPNQRDTSRDGWRNRLEYFVLTHGAPLWKAAQNHQTVSRFLNGTLINMAVAKMPYRPNPFSTNSDYTSWASLTDKSFSGRHLRAETAPSDLPSIEDVANLFVRKEGEFTPSPKSTVLFSYFAQWFTDGFLRSDRPAPRTPPDPRKNNSNNEIDLMQVYGIKPDVTDQLRSHEGGLLKSQIIKGEEYPPYLYESGAQKPEFTKVTWLRTGKIDPTPEQLSKFFAMGSDTGNLQLGFVLMTVLFFREHNRIARELAARNACWDDDRLFETARNISIVLLIKVAVNEYINHISPYHFKFTGDPQSLTKSLPWYRANWISVEFNLLYRWHSLVPPQYTVGEREVPIYETVYQTEMLTENGLGPPLQEASRQAAGQIGLFNTHPDLLEVEKESIKKARALSIPSYNEYRKLCQYPPVTAFNQITGDVRVQHALKALYGTVDRIELYTGLFAEEVPANSALPGLIGRMVGVDAFSQALTNPLLAPRIYNEATFSSWGKALIDSTRSLSDIVNRNVPGPGKYFISMTRRNEP